MKKLLLPGLCVILLFGSCKKGSNCCSAGGDFGEFLAKSQWVGVLSNNGYQFAPPANLRFKSATCCLVILVC